MITKHKAIRALKSRRGLGRRSAIRLRLCLERFAANCLNNRAASEVKGGFRAVMGHVLAFFALIGHYIAIGFDFSFGKLAILSAKTEALFKRLWQLCLSIKEQLSEVLYRHQKRQHGRFIPLVLMLCVVIMIFSASYFSVGLEVMLYGKSVGFISSKEEMESIISEVESLCGEYMGSPYSLQVDVEYTLGYFDARRAMDRNAVRELIFSEINEITPQYVLLVDGNTIGASGNRTALELMLRRIKASAVDTSNVKTEFIQDVKIEQRATSAMNVKSIAEMESILTSNVSEDQVYVVQNGDTISAIAQQHGTDLSTIRQLNPGLNVDSIAIGDQIKLSGSVPFLSVKQIKTEQYTESIPYTTDITYVDNLFVNQSRISTEGVNGSANVIADVTYVNGIESERIITSYIVTAEPINAVKQVGKKALPPKTATGNFVKPSSGIYSSGYGYRPRMGDFHTGIDFAGPVGTRIWAADGGTVTFAGRKGNYGLCVIIDHGNGYSTLYGHCSRLLVKSGQKVAKREDIAKVGSTGRSTGPHVHFEVKYRGKTQNPNNYIGR